mgnify:CR=1 FL=1
MKDPCDDIRDWMYATLNGAISYGGSVVSVYSFPPPGAAKPYIVIGDHEAAEIQPTKDCYIWDVTTTIEIYTAFANATKASYIPVNSISSQVLQLLVQRAYGGYGVEEGGVAFNDFNLVTCRPTGMRTERRISDTDIIIYKELNINQLLEEL